MIKTYSLKLLETAVNQALNLDTAVQDKLQPLAGKTLELVIGPLDVNFFIVFTDNKLCFCEQIDKPADTIIHSTPLGLIRLSLLPASKARSLFNDSVKISGDIELGEKTKRLFNELDVDWEGHLASFTGDVVAYQIGSWVKQGLGFQQNVRASLQRNVTEYVQEELQLFPGREEVNDFFSDIDQLRLDADRLEAHIKLLMDQP